MDTLCSPLPRTDFSDYVKENAVDYVRRANGRIATEPDEIKMAKAIVSYGMQDVVIDYGAEGVVMNMPDDPSRVYKFTYQDLSEFAAKRLYWLHKVLCTLYPNFPTMHAAFGSDEKNPPFLTGTVSQKVEIVREAHRAERGGDVKTPFPDMAAENKAMGMFIELDTPIGNQFLDADGTIVYLDKASLSVPSWNLTQTFRTMRERKYSAQDCATVVGAVGELALIGAVYLQEGEFEKIDRQSKGYLARQRLFGAAGQIAQRLLSR